MTDMSEIYESSVRKGKGVTRFLFRHKWGVYFTMVSIFALGLVLVGLNELNWARYYAMTRGTEFLRIAKFRPGPQPDLQARGALNALWATLHAAYAAAYFATASLLISVSAVIYTFRSEIQSFLEDLRSALID